MHFLRSLVFNFATYCGSFFSTLLALPTLVMPRAAMQYLARMLGFYIIFCVRFIINTKIIFKGLENIPKNRKFFIASAHQSICETEKANVACIPVKLNTGDVWPKDSFFRFPGEICIEFKKPIEPGLNSNDFMNKLEKEIYD